ncbi:MAG: ABC transporter permease subunit [Acidobacteria bacterium]|nr:ABC transporter permease subunit [Acidobacteriota bacterium]
MLPLKTLAIIEDTFRESFSRLTFVGFFVLSNLLVLAILFAVNLDVVDGVLAAATLFGKELHLNPQHGLQIGPIIRQVESAFAVTLYVMSIFLSVFATANLVPHMLEKGTIDLVLSKPLSRRGILLAKYLGALSVVSFNVWYLVAAVWLILSTKTQVWNFAFLAAALPILFTFAVLLGVVILVGTLSGSSSLAIMVTYVIFFVSQPLAAREKIVPLLDSQLSVTAFQTLYWVLPKTFELGNLVRETALSRPVQSWTPVWTSGLFGLGALVAAIAYFERKDY